MTVTVNSPLINSYESLTRIWIRAKYEYSFSTINNSNRELFTGSILSLSLPQRDLRDNMGYGHAICRLHHRSSGEQPPSVYRRTLPDSRRLDIRRRFTGGHCRTATVSDICCQPTGGHCWTSAVSDPVRKQRLSASGSRQTDGEYPTRQQICGISLIPMAARRPFTHGIDRHERLGRIYYNTNI